MKVKRWLLGCVSELLLTLLFPAALREDTPWLLWQLHLAVLILRFSGREGEGLRGMKGRWQRGGNQGGGIFFSRQSNTVTECHVRQEPQCAWENSNNMYTHTHTHTCTLSISLTFSLGNGQQDGSLLRNIIHWPWLEKAYQLDPAVEKIFPQSPTNQESRFSCHTSKRCHRLMSYDW